MGNEIPIPGTARGNCSTSAGANTTNMHESECGHNTRKHRKGSCAYTGVSTTNNSASEVGPVYQRTRIKIDPRGVSAFAQEVLGPAHVGEGIFLLHRGSCHRGNNTYLQREPARGRRKGKLQGQWRVSVVIFRWLSATGLSVGFSRNGTTLVVMKPTGFSR